MFAGSIRLFCFFLLVFPVYGVASDVTYASLDTALEKAVLVPYENNTQPRMVVSYDVKENAIVFPFRDMVAAAAFKRGDVLWLLFNRNTEMVFEPMLLVENEALVSIEHIQHYRYGVLRIRPREWESVSFVRKGYSWFLTFAPHDRSTYVQGVSFLADKEKGEYVRVDLSVSNHNEITFVDPDVGDEFLVVPSLFSDGGVKQGLRYIDFEVVPSIQGVFVQKFSDAVTLAFDTKGVNILGPSSRLLDASAMSAEDSSDDVSPEVEEDMPDSGTKTKGVSL